VFTPLSVPLSVPLKWPSTSGDPVAQCHSELMLHAPFSCSMDAVTNQSIESIYIQNVSAYMVCSIVERIQICIYIGCRSPDAEKIEHAGSAFCRWFTCQRFS